MRYHPRLFVSTLRSSILLLLSLGLGSGCSARHQEVLAERIPELLELGDVPGLSIAVVRGGELAWSDAFGVERAGSDVAVTERTVFPGASLSKPVFAYLVLRLVERGVLNLDRPLYQLLPYPRLEHDPRYRAITARRVLCHTAGLPNWGGTPLEMIAAPGERFRYSGEGYVYLQKVIEHLEATSLTELAQREVFGPLKMTDSAFAWRDDFAGRMVDGVDFRGEVQSVSRDAEANAAATLLTTAEDYARFLIAWIEGRGLRATSFETMRERQVEAVNDDAPETTGRIYWGLGWGLEAAERESAADRLWHWGDNDGFKAFIMLDLAAGDAVVYFANGTDGLSIAPPLVEAVVPGPHPAFAWNGYERYDEPRRLARREVLRAFLDHGVEAGLERWDTLEAKSPEIFDQPLVNGLGYALLWRHDTSELAGPAAVAVFRRETLRHPRSADAHDSLGEALMSSGELAAAVTSYRRAAELAPGDAGTSARLRWAEEALAAQRTPLDLDAGELAALTGDYERIHVRLEHGELIVDSDRDGHRHRLRAIDRTTFAFAERPRQRLRFVLDGERTTAVELLVLGRRPERLMKDKELFG